MKNRDVIWKIIILILLVVFIGIFIIFIINKNKLSVDDDLTKELYGYFDSDKINECDGLFNYSNEKVDVNSIGSETKLCVAYQMADKGSSSTKTFNKDKKNNTCTKDNLKFRLEDDEKECSYTIYEKKNINDEYVKIFGEEINSDTKFFQTDNTHICYIDDKYIYCGLSETITYVLSPKINLYRTIEKTKEKGSEVYIYDYFLRVIGDKCYNTYTTDTENANCSNKITYAKNINYKFLKKYGTLYKHTYLKDDSGTYHWVSSEPVK